MRRFLLKKRYFVPSQGAGDPFRVAPLCAGPPVDFYVEDVVRGRFDDAAAASLPYAGQHPAVSSY